jgi:N-acetylmuramoyl-L-alanine amidase
VAPSFPTAVPTDTPAPPTEAPLPTSTPAPLPTPLPTATPQITLTVGADGANVRSGPGTFYDQLGRLDPGGTAVVTGRYDKWLRIDFNGADGWVANWIVTVSDIDSVPQVEPPSETEGEEEPTAEAPTEEATQEPTAEPTAAAPGTAVTATLTAGVDGANVRTGPGTEYERIGRLEPGDTAVITGKYERWFQIDYNGTPAWVANWVVEATGAENVPEVEPPAPESGSEVTATPEGQT